MLKTLEICLINKTSIWNCSFSNATRGIYGGGYEHSPASDVTNNLYYITIASTGNAIDFGDVTSGHHQWVLDVHHLFVEYLLVVLILKSQ